MQFSYTDLLSDILTVIGYSHKEKFIREFEQANQLEALEKCIKKFSQELQNSILANAVTHEEIINLINPEVYHNELLHVSADALTSFLEHMMPVLTSEQKNKIASILHGAQQNKRIL